MLERISVPPTVVKSFLCYFILFIESVCYDHILVETTGGNSTRLSTALSLRSSLAW